MFVEAADRLADGGQPAVALLGGTINPAWLWGSITEALGLPPLGADQLLDAMEAAAQAANAPFVLLIDALNDSSEPYRWADVLPAFLAAVKRRPWIVVGFSLRKGYEPVVLPESELGDRVAHVEHHGFATRETEAIDRYFDHYRLEPPRVPLLAAEFTNPLFLKLYCQGLKEAGLTAPDLGHQHLTQVFDRWVDGRLRRVTRKLQLRPHVAARALGEFTEALIAAGNDRLDYPNAEALIDRHAAHLNQWPETLTGRLLSEGLLTKEIQLNWDGQRAIAREVLRFSYQRLADHRVVDLALRRHRDDKDLRTALRAKQPLRVWILNAPHGWLEALSIQVPERFGLELVDAAQWRLSQQTRARWLHALVYGIAARSAGSITERTRRLLSEAQQQSRFLADAVLDSLIAVAPLPGHPMNAELLHRWLVRLPMPERDAAWGIRTYGANEEGAAFTRLLRWAAQGPYRYVSDDVAELTALPLVWMLCSPNRFTRDYSTRALYAPLRDRLTVVTRLVKPAYEIDDPYVTERVAPVAYGVLLSSGGASHTVGCAACEALRGLLEHARAPNVLLRDAVRGAYEWGIRSGFLSNDDFVQVSPPYTSEAPRTPPPLDELERSYSYGNWEPSEAGYRGAGYGTLFGSLFGLADFGRYVVDSDVSRFTRAGHDEPMPLRDKPHYEGAQDLSETNEESLESLDLDRLLGERRRWIVPEPPAKYEYPGEEVRRWIFRRVIDLGWTPERFAAFHERLS